MFRKLKKGDIVEDDTGMKGVVVEIDVTEYDDEDVLVEFPKGYRIYYKRDELVRVDRLYKVIDKICKWLGV